MDGSKMSKKTNDRHMIYSTNCTEIQPPHGANIIDLNLFQQQQQLQAPSSVLRRNSSDSKIVLTVCVKNIGCFINLIVCLYGKVKTLFLNSLYI